MPSVTPSLCTPAENHSRQQQFSLALLAICFSISDSQQPTQGTRSLLLFELYLAFIYVTFTAAVVLSVLSLRPSGGGAAPATALIQQWGQPIGLVSASAAFVLRSCLDLPIPSLLRIWFFPMALAVALLVFLAWNKYRSAVATMPSTVMPSPSYSLTTPHLVFPHGARRRAPRLPRLE
ncbi:unnamed protein product [Spirodela intermedia]|uniref:Uncharacterized protein n=1 Tax=Spirodela intermedia TaxID=51605 RepID=A0A7I8LJX8_SPIIN|nr:unnamed protein product [Spirodela intermedia]